MSENIFPELVRLAQSHDFQFSTLTVFILSSTTRVNCPGWMVKNAGEMWQQLVSFQIVARILEWPPTPPPSSWWLSSKQRYPTQFSPLDVFFIAFKLGGFHPALCLSSCRAVPCPSLIAARCCYSKWTLPGVYEHNGNAHRSLSGCDAVWTMMLHGGRIRTE